MKIGIVAPSAVVDEELIQIAQKKLLEFDVETETSDHIFEKYRYLAGKNENKIKDLFSATNNPDIDAIWCGRGGTGAAQLLPLLDKWLLKKPVIGYSDSTILLNYIALNGGQALHAPTFQEIAYRNLNDSPISKDAQEVLALLNPLFKSQKNIYSIQPLNPSAEKLNNIEGHVLGGNLTTLCSVQGTPWALQLKHDSILLIEDVGEPFYRLERLFVQLLQSIDTSKLKAVVMGDFYNCPQKNVNHSLHEIFAEHLDPLNIPLYLGDWFGHGEKNRPFWIGKMGSINHLQLSI